MNQVRLLLTFLFAFFYSLSALAQNEQVGGNSLLPEINPQDIEIRSEFRARFPGLRRQPILGFTPEPRIYRIDPNRMPFMETRDEAVAGIEMTELDRPEPPLRTLLKVPPRSNVYLRAGIGSFMTPELEAYGFKKLNEKDLLSANLNYRSSQGHLEDKEGAFRTIDLQGNYLQKTSEKWRLGITAGLFSDHLTLFRSVLPEAPKKTNTGANAGVTIKKINNAFSGSVIELGAAVFTSEIPGPAACNLFCYGGELKEKTYFASYSIKWPGRNIYEVMNIRANVRGGNYDYAGLENWLLADASFSYERLFDFQTSISGTGRIEYVKDPFASKVYFSPEVEIQHNLSSNITITGGAFARTDIRSLQTHQQFNRFLDVDNVLRHSYETGAKGEVIFKALEGNAIFGGISYSHIKDYAYYQRQLNVSVPNGYYGISYDDAKIFELYAGITQQLVPEKFWFDARVYGRNHSLKAGGAIPYEERLGLEGSFSYKPFQKLQINAWAEYIGKRRDTAANEDLHAFALINAGAEYEINEKFGLYTKVLNILGQEYQIWNGYPERPFQVFGGLTIKF